MGNNDRLERLKALAQKASSLSAYALERKKSLQRLAQLFQKLQINQKVDHFDALFSFKAINLSAISLTPDRFKIVAPGKYAQLIAIVYEEKEGSSKRAKNINLRYFGRVERLEPELIDDIVEFTLRWRLEKAYRSVDRYRNLLERLEKGPLKKEE